MDKCSIESEKSYKLYNIKKLETKLNRYCQSFQTLRKKLQVLIVGNKRDSQIMKIFHVSASPLDNE